jgi:uncharacterized protein (DUF1778 family)
MMPIRSNRATKRKKSRATSTHPRITIRFSSPKEHRLILEAATIERMSVNGWLTRLAIAAAERELGLVAPAPAPQSAN